jgi:hypothetical protein
MTGLNLTQLKYDVVEPALVAIGLASTAALNLVTGTALVESGAQYVRQRDNGPALGLWQVEPATETDIWLTFLGYNTALAAQVKTLLQPYNSVDQRTAQLVANMAYGAAIARLKYRRAREPLPVWNDAAAMAAYHKRIYNTALGAANAATNTPLFQSAIDA